MEQKAAVANDSIRVRAELTHCIAYCTQHAVTNAVLVKLEGYWNTMVEALVDVQPFVDLTEVHVHASSILFAADKFLN